MFPLKRLIVTLHPKLDLLVLKSFLKVKCFAINQHHYILLETLTPLSLIKKYSICTGTRSPFQRPEGEQSDKLSTQLISGTLIHAQIKFLFPALKSSNNFAIVDYGALMNTKIKYSTNRVFETMSVAELNTRHTSEVERTQLVTSLAMSVKNP